MYISSDDLYDNYPYGAYYTKSGEKIQYNRYYQPLNDRKRWVEDVVKQEWYYLGGQTFEQKKKGALTQKPVWTSHKQ
jgi:hypothetical protein